MVSNTRIIEESDSSIVMKDDDGTIIRLKVLKHPIPIDDLVCEYEQETLQEKPKKVRKVQDAIRRQKPEEFQQNTETSNVIKISPVKFLKEPLSLHEVGMNLNVEEPVTINVKTFQRTYVQRSNKKLPSLEYQTWKQNALTLFEYSHVYPFIHAKNKYKCFICANSFLEAKDLKVHQDGHRIKEFKEELRNRIRDKSLKVDVSYLQCKICSNTLPDLMSLKTHLRDHGKEIDPDFQDNLIPFKLCGDTFECQICHEDFLKLRSLTIHMSSHFSNFNCEQCGSVFISLSLLKRHLQTHMNGSYPCDKCDKVFSNSAKRTLHMRGVHLKQFPRTCPMCPERFNSSYRRSKHLRSVHNQITGSHKCDTCGREYDLKYQLLIHVRSVHLQERDQECTVCQARFFSKYCLSRHMVIHTGEKNFKCETCGKAYARKKSLREHLKTHDVSHVSCTVCGLVFDDNEAFILHVNTTHRIV